MRTILTVSSERYSLDGVSYFKNYISDVKGDQITIFNCYDRNDVKVDWTHYSDITLNGVVYGSAVLLQSALMPVIYTRNSLAGGGGGTTPNLEQVLLAGSRKGIGLDGDHTLTTADIATKLVALDTTISADFEITIPLGVYPMGSTDNSFGSFLIVNRSGFNCTIIADTGVYLNSVDEGTKVIPPNTMVIIDSIASSGSDDWQTFLIPTTLGGSGGAVDSVNSQTGVVVLNASDVGAEDISNKAIDFSTLNDTLYPSVEAVSEYVSSQISASSMTEDGTLIRKIEIIKTGFEFAFNDNAAYTSLNTATWSAGTTKGAKLVSGGLQNFINTGKIIDNNVYSITLTAKATTSNTAYFGFGIKNGASWGGGIYNGSTGAFSMLNYNLGTFVSGGALATQPTYAIGDVISVRIIFAGKETYLQTAVNGVWNPTLAVAPTAMKIRHGGEIVIVNRTASTWDDMTITIEDVNEFQKEVFVTPSGGSDSNNGTYDFPLATITEAKQRTKGKGWITLKHGDYFDQTLTFQGGIKLRAENRNKVRLIYGVRFSSATLTVGTTKVYEVPYATTLNSGYVLWQHDTVDPASSIATADSHPLHRGASHRLTSCKSTWLGSVALLDATDDTRSNFFWSGGTLYFTLKAGTNLTDNPIVIPQNLGVGGSTDYQDVELLNIDVLYRGLNLSGTQFNLNEVSCLFSGASYGFQYGDAVGGIFRRCRAGGTNYVVGAGGDGFNGTNGTPTSATSNITTYIAHDCWSHDNEDDGDSLHNHASSSIFGGLYENNGGGGIASASGGHMTVNGAVIRNNTGNGVVATGTATDGGSFTNILAIGCVFINDGAGTGSGTNVVTLINCSFSGATAPTPGANTIVINCVNV